MKKLSFIISLIILFSSLTGAVFAENEGLVPCGNPGQEACTLCDLFVMIDRIIDFILFRIVPPLAALMIAIGGYMLIVQHIGFGGTGGGPEMVSRAKKLFTSVAMGLLIIYGAWLIVNSFFMAIGINETNSFRNLPENWWRINCE
jgi:hypothetical protein